MVEWNFTGKPGGSFPVSSGVKRQVRGADHSTPTRAEVKNDEAVLPLPIRLCSSAWLITRRNNLTSPLLFLYRSLVRAVGIATGYGLDGRRLGVRVPVFKNFLFSTSSRPVLGSTQPPIQWVPEALSPRVKRQGREADHSPPASAEVKKIWFSTSTPPYAFMP
jgi:hypothetical protein